MTLVLGLSVTPTLLESMEGGDKLQKIFHKWPHVFDGLFPSSADSRRVVVSYKLKYAHEVLVDPLVKLAQEKVWFGFLTVLTLL